jgi:putative cardiolipin synthase
MMPARFIVIVLAGLIAAIFIGGCATLPPAPPQPEISALRPAKFGELADLYSKITDRYGPGQSGFLHLEPHFIQDHPVTFDGAEHRLSDMLLYLAEPSHTELIMATPYLIPVNGFLDDLAKLSSDGVNIRIVTGSMGSNNHTVAHSHYKKYRRRILRTGAELYEFRHDPPPETREVSDVPPVRAKFISLHNKALAGDRQRCFIGSLNLDPRAIEINTENGLYMQSPELCGEMADLLKGLMTPDNAWRVFVDENDTLYWESSTGRVSIQPARRFWQRVADFFYRLIPIESQL